MESKKNYFLFLCCSLISFLCFIAAPEKVFNFLFFRSDAGNNVDDDDEERGNLNAFAFSEDNGANIRNT